MQSDSFIRILLVIIAIFLALDLLMPIVFNPVPTYAANTVQYKVDSVDLGKIGILKTSGLEKLLNEYSKEGWDAISVNVVTIRLGGKALVVLKK